MRHRKFFRTVGLWVIPIALLFPIGFMQHRLERLRYLFRLQEPLPAVELVTKLPPQAVTGVIFGAALGGFRGLAADMLWMRADEAFRDGDVDRMDRIGRTVTMLDPHFIEVWTVLGWNWAYNVWAEVAGDAEREKLALDRGLADLQDGVRLNPNRYDLYWEVAWTLTDKAADFPNGVHWLRRVLYFPDCRWNTQQHLAHSYETFGTADYMDRALEEYYLIMKDPRNEQEYGTGKGATITIRERYLPAFRLALQGRFEEALRVPMEYLAKENYKRQLPNHVMARLYEMKGDLRKAYDIYAWSGTVTGLDYLSVSRARELAPELGLAPFRKEENPAKIFKLNPYVAQSSTAPAPSPLPPSAPGGGTSSREEAPPTGSGTPAR